MTGEDGVVGGGNVPDDRDARDAGTVPDEAVPAQEPGAQTPSGPAPIIDLGDDAVPVRPAKPLGPRRLARLQRELQERSRELAENGVAAPDPELLAKQLRFAELAARVEAAHAGGAGAVEAATPEPGAPGPAAPGTPAPEEAEPGHPQPTEQITVVFPGSGDADGAGAPDPVHVDPALFSNRLAPEELAALTHIEIVPAGESEPRGAGPAPAAEDAAPPASSAPAEDDAAATSSASAGDDAAAPDPEGPAAGGPASGTPTSDPSTSGAPVPGEADPPPPAAPLPATRAEGLELLDPKEYRRRSGPAWAVLLLSLVVVVLLVVVIFVL